jgi:hypothetical protein
MHASCVERVICLSDVQTACDIGTTLSQSAAHGGQCAGKCFYWTPMNGAVCDTVRCSLIKLGNEVSEQS